jgi:hypothetical protein
MENQSFAHAGASKIAENRTSVIDSTSGNLLRGFFFLTDVVVWLVSYGPYRLGDTSAALPPIIERDFARPIPAPQDYSIGTNSFD